MRLSVIVPTLNEAMVLRSHLPGLRQEFPDDEIIVADGGSSDDTPSVARPHATVVSSPPGRATQMNAGARRATGEVLLFLHADCRLPQGARDALVGAVEREGCVGGAFEHRNEHDHWLVRLTSRVDNLRARWLHIFYGDQAVFVRKDVFRSIGGFREIPVMEDIEFSRRLRRAGHLSVLKGPVISSGRRWGMLGVWRTSLTHWLLTVLYLVGVSPVRIARLKRRLFRSPEPRTSERALLVFARDPFRGAVKTRLASALTPAGSARLYGAFLRDVTARCSGRPVELRAVVVVPPGGGPGMRRLVAGGYQWWVQQGANLGERMARAFERAFARGAQRVVIVGSDSPTLPEWLIGRTFNLLERVDVVLGPALDGGYYLVGLREPHPELFDLPEWSTSRVLVQTLRRAWKLGLAARLLPPWYDVDTQTDLRLLRLHLALAPMAAPATRKTLAETFSPSAEKGVTGAHV